jgi:hypothetical protein
MSYSTGKCLICGEKRTVGADDMPPGIAAEGVMESIQEHIFQEHCNDELELETDMYDGVGSAWEYV